MKATKSYGPCGCGCGERISRGKEFEVVDGGFFLDSHGRAASCESGEPSKIAEHKQTESTISKQQSTKKSAALRRNPEKINRMKRKEKRDDTEGLRSIESGDAETAQPAISLKIESNQSPNRMTIEMVIEQKHTDAEIIEAVSRAYPDRKVKQIKSDVSVNRSMLNSGKHYGSYINRFKPVLPLKKLVRVNGKLFPADSQPQVQEKPLPAKKRGLLKRSAANITGQG